MNNRIIGSNLKARVTVKLEYDLDNDNRWTVAIENEATVPQEDWVCELATQVHELVVEAQDTTDHAGEYGDLEDFRNALEVYVDPLWNFNNGHKCKKSNKRQLANISTKSTVDKLDIMHKSLDAYVAMSQDYLHSGSDVNNADVSRVERYKRSQVMQELDSALTMMNEIGDLRETINTYLR